MNPRFYEKSGFRTLVLDDGRFNKFKDRYVRVFALLVRGKWKIEDAYSFCIEVDGNCITSKLIELIEKEELKGTIHLGMSYGISFGGFNLLDIVEFYNVLRIPFIVVLDRYPDFSKIFDILSKIDPSGYKKNILKNQPEVKKIDGIFAQYIGLDERGVRAVIKRLCDEGKIPEPLKTVHTVASGITRSLKNAYCDT